MANVKKNNKSKYVSFYDLADKEIYISKSVKKGGKSIYIGYTGRVVSFVTLSIISLIAAFFAFYNGISYKKIKSFKYNENGIYSYRVYLNENNYYDKKFLEPGMNYLTSLIDYFELNVNYNYVGNQNTDISFKYDISGELKVYDIKNGNKVLFEKKYNILSEKAGTLTDRQLLQIKENIKIDYAYYNKIAKDFKRDFNLSASSDLKVIFHIETSLPQYGEEKTIHDMDITIPLTEQTINVALGNTKIENEKNIIHQEDTKITNMYLTVLACIAIILSIIMLSKAFKIIISAKKKKAPYIKKRNQILKEYDRAITITKNMIRILSDDNVIDIDSFEELLDIRDTLNAPILFNEIHKDQKGWFIIKKGQDVYKYVLKASELEKTNVKE